VEFQISEGIDGLVPCGTTGEAVTLSGEEQLAVLRAVVEQARGRVPVIAGAGANDTAKAVDHSRAAAGAGVDGLLHVTPYYNKPPPRGLVAHFEAVAGATGLPVIAYNVPGRTSCDMLPETVVRVAAVPGVVGIKEATGSVARVQRVIAACPADFAVLSGDDITCLAATAVGGAGVISVISNLLPGPMAEMIREARGGSLARAREIQYRYQALMDLLFVEANPIPVKAAMALMGYGVNEVRPPLAPLSGERLEALAGELRRLGVTA
jgi:4-hydroxy-tetrahydrodipicolinate synthase